MGPGANELLVGLSGWSQATREGLAHRPLAGGRRPAGLCFAHPESHDVRVGRIERDQAEDHARRKGMSVAEVERRLGSILNYEA